MKYRSLYGNFVYKASVIHASLYQCNTYESSNLSPTSVPTQNSIEMHITHP